MQKQSDPLLRAFLNAPDEAEQERVLMNLLTRHAAPIIQRVVQREFGVSVERDSTQQSEDARDVQSDALSKVCEELRRQQQQQLARAPIERFGAYVDAVTTNVYRSYLRRKYPARRHLEDELRELLTGKAGQTGFAIWVDPIGIRNERLCGFDEWRNQGKTSGSQYRDLVHDAQVLQREALHHDDPRYMNPALVVKAVFDWAGGPIGFQDLVRVMAVLLGIRDEVARAQTPDAESDDGERQHDFLEAIPDTPDLQPEHNLLRREFLRWFWAEICAMSLEHRRAVLLQHNTNYLRELADARVASLRVVASQLEMPAEELAAMVLDGLPHDAALVARFGFADPMTVANRRMTGWRALSARWRKTFIEKKDAN